MKNADAKQQPPRRTGPAITAVTTVWLVLMVATGLTAWLIEGRPLSPAVSTTGAMLIACFKARLVAMHFMELHDAPPPWRWLFEAWILGCTAFVLAGWWLA